MDGIAQTQAGARERGVECVELLAEGRDGWAAMR
ncbi:MAG: hypothetical protein BWX48_00758 [Verrucomicrobia bacterium ADurb.Bin006]|jgi:hypothetical protein|nr:MAG: hypothetical protein BWX48_00758 [Verrucomicrobia bacterium ADurb.Bin006]